MEHTMYLALKAFLEEICPTPSRYKQKNKSMSIADVDDEHDDKVHALPQAKYSCSGGRC
jgi:hypothetical protein